MRECPRCQQEIQETDNYCRNCGCSFLISRNSQQDWREKLPQALLSLAIGWNILGILIAGVVVIAIVLLIIFAIVSGSP